LSVPRPRPDDRDDPGQHRRLSHREGDRRHDREADHRKMGGPADMKKAARLRELILRQDKVLTVLHPPTAAHARIMERAGCECGFVGTSGVVGAYTGMADVGTATMTECVQIAGWIANSVNFPIIMDGDTGHGGVMAVRRMVRECIKAGI